jgi:hypothetical protein
VNEWKLLKQAAAHTRTFNPMNIFPQLYKYTSASVAMPPKRSAPRADRSIDVRPVVPDLPLNVVKRVLDFVPTAYLPQAMRADPTYRRRPAQPFWAALASAVAALGASQPWSLQIKGGARAAPLVYLKCQPSKDIYGSSMTIALRTLLEAPSLSPSDSVVALDIERVESVGDLRLLVEMPPSRTQTVEPDGNGGERKYWHSHYEVLLRPKSDGKWRPMCDPPEPYNKSSQKADKYFACVERALRAAGGHRTLEQAINDALSVEQSGGLRVVITVAPDVLPRALQSARAVLEQRFGRDRIRVRSNGAI